MDDNTIDSTKPKTKSPKKQDETKPLTKTDTPHTDTETDSQDTSDDVKPKLFVLEPGKKMAQVSEDEEVAPKTKTTDAHKINNDVKSKPNDKNHKSESDQPHLNGDDAKPTGVTKAGITVPQIIEEPVAGSNDNEDTMTEAEENKIKPRIQDRKGSIRELIPDKKHGFQLNLKVVAFLHSEFYSSFCYIIIFSFTRATLLPTILAQY